MTSADYHAFRSPHETFQKLPGNADPHLPCFPGELHSQPGVLATLEKRSGGGAIWGAVDWLKWSRYSRLRMPDPGEIFSQQRQPFLIGETAIVVEPRGKQHYIRLRPGARFFNRWTGNVAHDLIIGQPPGTVVTSESDVLVVCLRPTLEEYILKKLRRKTTIIHPKDLASLLLRGDLYPGARVLESGIGSGATSLVLLRYLSPGGQLISYERRQEFADLARENIEKAHTLYGDPGTPHEIRDLDIYEGIQESDLDLVLLDVPEPDRAQAHAAAALRPGGTLLSWLPTVNQVFLLVESLRDEACWGEIEVRETLERDWVVSRKSVRPAHRMTGHTGFLTRARYLERNP